MYTIYFGNANTFDAIRDRFCVVYCEASMFACFDALCMKFLHVTVWNSKGDTVRDYNNTLTMGV